MSLADNVAIEVQMLIGNLYAVRIKIPDTAVYLDGVIDLFEDALTEPTEDKIKLVADEMIELNKYFNVLTSKMPELKPAFMPSYELTNHLLGPT